MSITREQITHLARLARLGSDPDEAEQYAEQLSRIMELVQQMNLINTEKITPMSHPQETGLRLRADETDSQQQGEKRRSDYQRIAPDTELGLYLVPQVIE